VLLLLMAAGCATTQQAASKGEEAIEHRNWDAAVYYYLEALAREPDNLKYRMALIRARQKASEEHFSRGVVLRDLGRLMPARQEMEMAVQLDPTNQYAEQELEKLIHDLEILSQPEGEATLEELKRQAREAKVQPPLLDPRVDEKVSLNFPTARPVKEIYKAISKAYGFNVTFDSKLKDDKLSIELNDVTAERALELVMQQANHFYKVLDEHSIIIAEDTPQNRREYEDLVIKTFFLSNAEVKDVDKLLRSLIEARRLATNEQLNAITLRDTADKVAIAEKLITINDKAKAEVLVDVELLQVNSSRERDIGANLSSLSFGLTVDLDNVTGPDGEPVPQPDNAKDPSLYLTDLGNISRDDIFINIPSVVINLIKSSGESETLAQPQLRITEGEKASLVIGDEVPIPVTAFNSGNTGGGGVVPITSFQYKSVGIKIDVEPRVHHNREITLKLTVEVSQVGDPVSVGPGQSAVTIGTRTINSVIRLKNGESSLLAGLLRVDRTEANSKTPLLSDIPVIGRLFTNVKTSHRTTDLILTLTPHVIRFPDIHEEDLAPVWVGTESRITYFGSRPRVAAGASPAGPFDQRGEDESGRARSTPRGRSPGTAGERSQPRRPTQPQGRNLVPSITQEESAPLYEDNSYDSRYGTEGSVAPVLVRLEPAIATIASGQQLDLRLVSVGGSGSFRLPLGLSFDSKRITVLDVDPSPGVLVAEQKLDLENGWFTLDLIVGEGDDLPQVLATVLIQGESPGPVPLLLSCEGAVDSDGSFRQVAVEDGTLLVQEQEVIFSVGGGPQ
jgi:general secretion pathway protein D